MGVIHLGPLSALPGTCIVLRALAMLYDPGGTCTVLAYRPAHYCLRPKLEYRLPLVVLSRLNRFTLSHYGSRTPLSTLHAGLTASHARLSTGCLLGFAGSGLSPDYTIHAELAHNLRTLRPKGRSIFREALIKSLSDFILEFLCNARNGGDANSELFKELHDEAVHKNSYKSRLCELISASLEPYKRRRPCSPNLSLKSS